MRTLTLFTAIAVIASLAGASSAAPKLDAQGKCRDSGKFVAASMCAAKSAPAAGQKCRDVKTKKFAKCGAPGTEVVVAKPK